MSGLKDNELIGCKVVDIRPATDAEIKQNGWDPEYDNATVVVLSSGVKLLPSRDHEGNGSGALFAMKGNHCYGFN